METPQEHKETCFVFKILQLQHTLQFNISCGLLWSLKNLHLFLAIDWSFPLRWCTLTAMKYSRLLVGVKVQLLGAVSAWETPSSWSEMRGSQNFKIGGTLWCRYVQPYPGKGLYMVMLLGEEAKALRQVFSAAGVQWCAVLILLLHILQLKFWAKNPSWSGIKMLILQKERAFFWSKWKSLLNGSRMLKKVTKQLSSQVELVHFGNLSAIMLCLGWGVGC